MQNETTPQKPTTPVVQINNQNLHEYTDEDGNISFPGAVVFEGDLYCKGYLTCEGDLYCKGYLTCESYLFCYGYLFCKGNLVCYGDLVCKGNLECKGNLVCYGDLVCKGYLFCEGYLFCKGDLTCEGDLVCKGNLVCEGYLECKGTHIVVGGTLYWSHVSMPTLPEKSYIKFVAPPFWQKDHYLSRFRFAPSSESAEQDRPKAIELLKEKDKWLPIERLILECIRDYKNEPPQWVKELKGSLIFENAAGVSK